MGEKTSKRRIERTIRYAKQRELELAAKSGRSGSVAYLTIRGAPGKREIVDIYQSLGIFQNSYAGAE